MERKKTYRMIVLSVGIILLSISMYLGFTYTKKINKQLQEQNNINNQNIETENVSSVANVDLEDSQVSIYENKQIEIVYENYYTLDNVIETTSNVYYGMDVDEILKKQEKEEYEASFEIKKESDEKIIYKRTLERYSPNNFFVKLENNNVVIYSVITDEEMQIQQNTLITENEIRPEIVELLKEGIEVTSKDELNSIIEDIET